LYQYTYETQQVEQVQYVLAQKRADGHNFGGNVDRNEATTDVRRANVNISILFQDYRLSILRNENNVVNLDHHDILTKTMSNDNQRVRTTIDSKRSRLIDRPPSKVPT